VSNIVTLDASGDSEIEVFGDPVKYELKRFTDTATIKKKQLTK
jgi:hypothetical protein